MYLDNCYFRDDLLYSPEHHVWVGKNGENYLLGVDSVMTWLCGPLTSISLKEVGKRYERGQILASLESAKHFEVVRAPVPLRIVDANRELAENPRLVNRDPYERGWLFVVEVEELTGLFEAKDALHMLNSQITQMRVKCFKEFPDIDMYEIGVECSATIVKLNEVMQKAEKGMVVHLVSDDPTAEIEMIRWTDQTGNELIETRKEGNLKHFIVKKK